MYDGRCTHAQTRRAHKRQPERLGKAHCPKMVDRDGRSRRRARRQRTADTGARRAETRSKSPARGGEITRIAGTCNDRRREGYAAAYPAGSRGHSGCLTSGHKSRNCIGTEFNLRTDCCGTLWQFPARCSYFAENPVLTKAVIVTDLAVIFELERRE